METHKTVKLYIDRVEKESPENTNGTALYKLGNINPATHDLWQEEKGKNDDQLVEDNTHPIHLKDWEHFYSAQKNLNPGNGNYKC